MTGHWQLWRRGRARLGKTPVLVRDSPGFVVNRVLMPYLNEAMLLVGEGVNVGEIDAAMKRALACRWDRWNCSIKLASTWPLTSPRRCNRHWRAAFRRWVHSPRCAHEGLAGQKSGKGFYQHGGKKQRSNLLVQEPTSPDTTIRNHVLIRHCRRPRASVRASAHGPADG